MAIFTLAEFIDAIIMTVAVGFIFSGFFRINPHASRFDWQNFKLAIMITVPAIILHELAHKFVAVSFGLSATFNAAYFWLAIGLILALLNFNFIFFVPAYVSIGSGATPLETAAIAFAGPGMNGLMWLISRHMLANKKLSRRSFIIWIMTKKINGFLFVFNMLPFPLFDGWKVYQGIIQAFF